MPLQQSSFFWHGVGSGSRIAEDAAEHSAARGEARSLLGVKDPLQTQVRIGIFTPIL